MSRLKIFIIYTIVDLLIFGGAIWCAFHRWPVAKYLIPVAILFVLNGVWLVWMTLRNTPKGS